MPYAEPSARARAARARAGRRGVSDTTWNSWRRRYHDAPWPAAPDNTVPLTPFETMVRIHGWDELTRRIADCEGDTDYARRVTSTDMLTAAASLYQLAGRKARTAATSDSAPAALRRAAAYLTGEATRRTGKRTD